MRGVAGSLLNKDIEQKIHSDYKTRGLKAWHHLVGRVQDKSQSTIGIPGARQQPGICHVEKSRLSRGKFPARSLARDDQGSHQLFLFSRNKAYASLPTVDDEEMNTTQGQELYVKGNVDHAAELALSLQRGGTSMEMFSEE